MSTPPTSSTTLHLNERHREEILVKSGISLAVAETRRYASLTTDDAPKLEKAGFSATQAALLPGYITPVYSPCDGSKPATWVLKPDEPRHIDTRVCKYEQPAGRPPEIDLHPINFEKIKDPSIPLFITEGVKKGDAGTSRGLVVLSVIGVFNWRGENPLGGLTALGSWEAVALKGARNKPRDVYIAFDSDAVTKPGVNAAMSRLGAFLKQRGAKVRFIYFPGGEDGSKVGLDDYFVAGGTVDGLFGFASDELRSIPSTSTRTAAEVIATRFGQRLRTAPVEPVHSSEEWDEVVPFTETDRVTFPVSALPSVVADMTAYVAGAVQVPTDLACLTALTIISGVTSRLARLVVPPAQRNHVESLNLYFIGAAHSGTRKSPLLTPIVKPLRDIEEGLRSYHLDHNIGIIAQFESEKKRLESMKTSPKNENYADRQARLSDVAALAESLEHNPPPTEPKLTIQNITTEELAYTLAGQPENCITLITAEAGIFSLIQGQYSNSKERANMDAWLSAWSGEPIVVDRASIGRREARSPMLTMLVLLQPDILRSMSEGDRLRENGFMQRFLFCIPESLVGTRMFQHDIPVAGHLEYAYDRMIKMMFGLPRAGSNPCARHTLTIDPVALDVYAYFYNDVETRQAPGGDLAGIAGWASKLHGNVLRIAANLHMIKHVDAHGYPWAQPIDAETMAEAWEVGLYLIPHAKQAFGIMSGDGIDSLAQRVVAWIGRSDQRSFSVRDCYRAHQMETRERIELALYRLQERCYVRLQMPEPRKPGEKGRPKSVEYGTNPSLFKK